MEKKEVLDLMKSSKNPQEWNDNCDKVKKAHGNNYPDYWFLEIVVSGLIDKTLGSDSSEIKITSLK